MSVVMNVGDRNPFFLEAGAWFTASGGCEVIVDRGPTKIRQKIGATEQQVGPFLSDAQILIIAFEETTYLVRPPEAWIPRSELIGEGGAAYIGITSTDDRSLTAITKLDQYIEAAPRLSTYAKVRLNTTTRASVFKVIGQGIAGDFLADHADTTSGAWFTGSIATTVLTVSAVANGTLAVGQAINDSTGATVAYITSLGTGTGGTGTYNLSASLTRGSMTMSADNGGTVLVRVSDGLRTKRPIADRKVMLDWMGVTGDDTGDDRYQIQSAIDTGYDILGKKGATYLVSGTLSFKDAEYDFCDSTLKANATFSTVVVPEFNGVANVAKKVIAYFPQGFQRRCLRRVLLNGNTSAELGVYGYRIFSYESIIERTTARNCTENGYHFIECQTWALRNNFAYANGQDGFFFQKCNALDSYDNESNANTRHGMHVFQGTGGNGSSGMTVRDSTIQLNGGDGIHVDDPSTPVTVKGNWFEQNVGHGIYVLGRGANYAKVFIHNNMIAVDGTASKYAVYMDTLARGVVRHNVLPTPSGFDGARVYFNNTGLSDNFAQIGVVIEPNYAGVSGAITTPVLAVAQNEFVLEANSWFWHAMKKIDVSDTVSYTKVLTAKVTSTLEVTISSVDTNNGATGQSIYKTWTSSNGNTRQSTPEIGGGTNTFTSNTFYAPLLLGSHELYVRWNGDDLEIKPVNAADNLWIVDVKAYTAGTGNRPTWIL